MNKQNILNLLHHKLLKDQLKSLSVDEVNLLTQYSTASTLTKQTVETLSKHNIITWPLSTVDNETILCCSDIKKIPKHIKCTILYNTGGEVYTDHQRVWLYVNGYDDTNMPSCAVCGVTTRWSSRVKGFTRHCGNRCRALDPEVNEKRKNSCIQKYGYDKSLANKTHVDITRKTCLANHGVVYPLQSSDVNERSDISKIEKYGSDYRVLFRQHALRTLQDRYVDGDRDAGYGDIMKTQSLIDKRKASRKEHWLPTRQESFSTSSIPLYTPSDFVDRFSVLPYKCTKCDTTYNCSIEDGKIPRCPTCLPLNRISFAETELADYIKTLGVAVTQNTRRVIPPKELDIVMDGHNLAIEYNGLYWHSEQGSRGRVDKHYHLSKTVECQKKGIHLMHIFEDEWIQKPNIVRSLVASGVGKYNQVIYARKCTIVELSPKTAKRFLSEHHIQGYTPSKINIGLEYNGELVLVMTFGKSRFNKNIQYEMYRLCSKSHTMIYGGAQRVFKHFTKQHSPLSVLSYADKRLFTGNIYTNLGFELSHTTKPGYWYVDVVGGCGARLNRQQFQKHKLSNRFGDQFNPSTTEHENMISNGYSKLWDCGQMVFVWFC